MNKNISILIALTLTVALSTTAVAGGEEEHNEEEMYAMLPGPDESTLMAENESASLVFDEVGHYMYHCHPHEALGMEATLEVVDPADAGPDTLSGEVHVDMTDYAYDLEDLEITTGTNVTWHNHAVAGHNVLLMEIHEEAHDEESDSGLPLLAWLLPTIGVVLLLAILGFLRLRKKD